MLLSSPSKYTTTVPTYILFVTSFSTDRSLARRTVVAVVAGALEGLVEAAPELAVGPLQPASQLQAFEISEAGLINHCVKAFKATCHRSKQRSIPGHSKTD